MGERWKSQHGSNILSTHIFFVPWQSAIPFLRYDFFKIWPWKSKVKVIVDVKVESHNMGPTFYRLTSLSFHGNRPSHFWDIFFLLNLTLKIQGEGEITMMLHNYSSRQFHITLNGINPSSSFRDLGSAKSGPNLCQVFGPWASPYGANGQLTMTVHNYRPRQFHRTWNGENLSSAYRDMGSASLAAARPQVWTMKTIPLQPGGLRGNKKLYVRETKCKFITHFKAISWRRRSDGRRKLLPFTFCCD